MPSRSGNDKRGRGLAGASPEVKREVASKGGRAFHAKRGNHGHDSRSDNQE